MVKPVILTFLPGLMECTIDETRDKFGQLLLCPGIVYIEISRNCEAFELDGIRWGIFLKF